MTSEVRLSGTGPGETVLPAPSEAERNAIAAASSSTDRLGSIRSFCAEHPRSLHGWAALGATTPDVLESYMAFRIGYHRGLDALRAAGWRGSGFVRSRHAENRGFLDCLRGLARRAADIGEDDEAERCRLFAVQLDPGGP